MFATREKGEDGLDNVAGRNGFFRCARGLRVKGEG
jgi:hypothetical protein